MTMRSSLEAQRLTRMIPFDTSSHFSRCSSCFHMLFKKSKVVLSSMPPGTSFEFPENHVSISVPSWKTQRHTGVAIPDSGLQKTGDR